MSHHQHNPVTGPTDTLDDSPEAIAALLAADDATLQQWIDADQAIRDAIRHGDRDADKLRTLAAAARIEHRRRARAAAIAALLEQVA